MNGPGAGPGAVAWIDGRWGSPAELAVPLNDRGLLLADGLFETILVQSGRPQLLEAHLRRWRESAALLAMAPPPARSRLEPLIHEAIERAGLGAGMNTGLGAGGFAAGPGQSRCGALRLNWSRGAGGGRGIDLPDPTERPGRPGRPEPQPATGDPAEEPHGHQFWLQLSPCRPCFEAQTAHISRHERRNGDSRLSRCKTFAYGQAVQARHEARQAGAEEGLLLGSGGGLCCGAVGNLLVKHAGRWLTPPLSSGCLPGVMRARTLELGLAEEATLAWDGRRLRAAGPAGEAAVTVDGPWLLINSLGCRPLSAVDGQALPPLSAAAAEAFWRQLL